MILIYNLIIILILNNAFLLASLVFLILQLLQSPS